MKYYVSKSELWPYYLLETDEFWGENFVDLPEELVHRIRVANSEFFLLQEILEDYYEDANNEISSSTNL